jgi:hypothetical protein
MRGLEVSAILFAGYFIVTNNPLRGSYFLTYGLFFAFLINFLFETYCVEILESETIIFKKIIFTKSFNVKDVVRLSKGFKFESVILQQDKITLSPFLSNLPTLKSTLKQLNPNIEVIDNAENPENVKRTILEIVLGFIVFATLLVVYFLFYFKG